MRFIMDLKCLPFLGMTYLLCHFVTVGRSEDLTSTSDLTSTASTETSTPTLPSTTPTETSTPTLPSTTPTETSSPTSTAPTETSTSTSTAPTETKTAPTVDQRADADTDLIQYLQPNDIASGRYDNITLQQAEQIGLCARPCDGAKPMICYFVFTIENYCTVGPACADCLKGNKADCLRKDCITADGFEREMLCINRQLPGPSIQVCKGDTIVVDVRNHMLDREVTIHWHGVYMRETPWMDGVPMITQCPIPCATTFRYKFPAMPVGSFFFHSHTGLQKMDGLEGSLIIRTPKSTDGNMAQYDFDLFSHVIILSDWMHSMTDSKYPGNTYNDTRIQPDALLINGQNQIENGPQVPMHFFNVQRGRRYVFRLIGGSCLACPLIFTIEKHSLLVVAADGTSVEPFEVDSITLFPGDRIDIVVNANQLSQQYWIQAKTMCDVITAEAVLQYDNAATQCTPSRPKSGTFKRGKSLNGMDINPTCKEGGDGVCWSHVNSLTPPVNASVLKATVDRKITIALGEYFFNAGPLFWFDNDEYHRFMQSAPVLLTHLINNRSFMLPPFPLLTQNNTLPPGLVCPTDPAQCVNREGLKTGGLCECVNIIQVDLGQVAEIILIDWGGANFLHPMHLHGTDMFIIEQGKKTPGVDNQAFVDNLRDRLAQEGASLSQTRPRPCVKDTVTIPPGGYAVVRVNFNNPGFWLCHCHYLFHGDTGMAMVFQVGTRDQFVPPPPDFPQCNNFVPPVSPNDFSNVTWEDEPTG